METITSLKNTKVQAWKSLKDKKGREMHHAFLVEGPKMVREALASGMMVKAVLLRENLGVSFDLPAAIPAFVLPEHIFSSISDTKTPQGIAAVMDLETKPADGPRLLALDGVQDPGNVGTIIRTADAAGFNGILFSRECDHGQHFPPWFFLPAFPARKSGSIEKEGLLRPFFPVRRRTIL